MRFLEMCKTEQEKPRLSTRKRWPRADAGIFATSGAVGSDSEQQHATGNEALSTYRGATVAERRAYLARWAS